MINSNMLFTSTSQLSESYRISLAVVVNWLVQ